MKREEYERRLLARLHARHRWETLPASGWSIADMDADEIGQRLQNPPGVRMIQQLLAALVQSGRVVRTGKGRLPRYRPAG